MNDGGSILAVLLRVLIVLGFLGAAAILLYALYVLYFYTAQRSMLFPRQFVPVVAPVFQADNAVDLSVETEEGPVEAWLLLPGRADAEPTPPHPLIIIGHGNAEVIDLWVHAVEPLRARGMAVLLVEYPGYGRSAGAPTEAGIVHVFVEAYDAAVARPDIDGERVLLFGRSVGGAAVAKLAAQRPSAGMVLFSTFTSVRDMAALYRLPGRLARDPFDALAAVRTYDRPLLILHGEGDPVIPFAHAERLHAAAPRSELRPLPCGHNDCVRDWEVFWADLEDFWRLTLE